jgi:hypothetical protein
MHAGHGSTAPLSASSNAGNLTGCQHSLPECLHAPEEPKKPAFEECECMQDMTEQQGQQELDADETLKKPTAGCTAAGWQQMHVQVCEQMCV